jgi:hypothetical protein
VGDQCCRRVDSETGQFQCRQTCRVENRVGLGPQESEQRNRVGHQATRDEAERLSGCRVQKVRVVDEQEQRTIFGALAQQTQRSDPDREPLRGGTAPQSKGDLKRVAQLRG